MSLPQGPRLLARTGSRQARGDRQSHGIFDRNVERRNAVARQVNGVAAEGVAHGEIHGHPVMATMRKQYLRYVFASDETDCVHIRESGQYHALQVALLAAAGGQQTDDVAKSAIEGLHERYSAQEVIPIFEQDLAGI